MEVQNDGPPLLNNMGGHHAKLPHKFRMNQDDDTPRGGGLMKGHKNPPKRKAASKRAVVTLSPMRFEKDNDVVPPGESHDTILLKLKARKVGIDRMHKTVHVPRDNPEAPGA